MSIVCSSCGKKKPFLFNDGFKTYNQKTYCSVCINKAKRDYFCQEIKPFVDANLATEFYYNQHYSVCNFANWAYGLIFYNKVPFEVLFLTPSQLDYMNLEMFNAVSEVNKMARRGVRNCSPLSGKLFTELQEIKRDTDTNGPSSYIDLTFEEYWSKRKGERIKEYKLPDMDIVVD